jgi:hypothetical protein
MLDSARDKKVTYADSSHAGQRRDPTLQFLDDTRTWYEVLVHQYRVFKLLIWECLGSADRHQRTTNPPDQNFRELVPNT